MKVKPSRTDFTQDLLPHTRKEVYKDVMRQHLGKFFLYGLIVLVCSLPFHFIAVYELFYQSSLYATLTPSATEEEVLLVANMALNFNNLVLVIQIPCLILIAIPLSGLARIIRQFGWEENVYFKDDFIIGIKQNAKQFVLLAALLGMVRFICGFIKNMLTMQSGTVYQWLSSVPAILCLMFLACPAAYACVAGSIYENRFKYNLRIGFRSYATHPWKTLLAAFCGLAIFIFQTEIWSYFLSALPVIIIQIVGRVISSVAVPFIMLGFWLFSYNVFDEVVNKNDHPELVGKGTFPKTENREES